MNKWGIKVHAVPVRYKGNFLKNSSLILNLDVEAHDYQDANDTALMIARNLVSGQEWTVIETTCRG